MKYSEIGREEKIKCRDHIKREMKEKVVKIKKIEGKKGDDRVCSEVMAR
jgi:hypothetical protein